MQIDTSRVLRVKTIHVPKGIALNAIPNDSLDYQKFGAKMDGVSDDTEAVQTPIHHLARRQVISSAGRGFFNNTHKPDTTNKTPPSYARLLPLLTTHQPNP